MNKEVAELVAEQNEEDLSVREYSGRGMFGQETYGIVFSDIGMLISAIISATAENPDTMLDNAEAFGRFDQMGLDQIIY